MAQHLESLRLLLQGLIDLQYPHDDIQLSSIPVFSDLSYPHPAPNPQSLQALGMHMVQEHRHRQNSHTYYISIKN